MKFALSTIAWVESIAKKEIEKVGWKIENTIDKLITFSWEPELIAKVNLWSRVGNKVYIVLWEFEEVTDFEYFFEVIKSINYKKYFKNNNPILIKSSSARSELFSARTMQSLGKKAIVKSLVWEWIYPEDENSEKVEILLLLVDNKLRVLLNTTWEALHKRWYRTESGEAPIKESLAAALVLLSGWKFKENFYDFFCGSWTIAIEALMIAKNIAPWLHRKFAFEKLGILQSEIVENERKLARKKEFSGEYKIFASDIDEEVLEIAKNNAKKAGLEWQIIFEKKDFKEYIWKENLNWTLVSNPPYWDRLKPENLETIYNSIDKIFRKNENLNGWIISSFLEFDDLIKKNFYKKRKLYNGGEMCYFWKKV